MKKKLSSLLLAGCMMLGMLPTVAFAEGETVDPAQDAGTTPVEETVADPVAKIGDTGYKTLVDAVAAANSGDTIVLQKDAEGAGIGTFKSGNPIAVKNFTIDFNGKTYTCTGPVGSPGTVSQAFHLEWTGDGDNNANVTLKDGTITAAENSGVLMLVQNYCNLTLDNMTLDGSKLPNTNVGSYAMSNNCGNVTIKDTTIIASTIVDSSVAFDADNYTYSGVTVNVTGNSKIQGIIELTERQSNEAEAKIVISGGTFNTDPSGFLAPNCDVEDKGDEFVVGPAVTSVTLDKASLNVEEGESVNLTATVEPTNAVNAGVTWASSNNDVATVTDGVVTAVAAGTATITAKTANGQSATCTITVTAKPEPQPDPIKPEADGNGNVTITGTETDTSKDTVAIDASAATSGSITIEADTAAALGATDKSVEIQAKDATVEFDKTAMDVIANAGQVVLNVAVADTTTAAKEVTLTLVDAKNGNVLPESSAAKNGTVTVTVPDAAGKDGKAEVYYLKDGKTEQWIASTVNDNKSVTFETTHFSKYLIKQSTHTCVDKNPEDGKCDVCGAAMLFQPDPSCDGKDKCPTAKYNDLKNKDAKVWYHQAVDFVVLNEIMIGTTKDNKNLVWGLGQTISRAEIAQIMYNMTAAEGYEAPKKATFTDVPVDEWYFKAVEWANTDGCMVGTGEGKFEPTRAVTRQEYAAVMYRVVTKGMSATEKKEFDAMCNAVKLDAFTDSKQIDNWAVTGVKMCVASEIMKGNEYKQLMPKKGATREEAAQMIMNFLNMEEK